LRRLLDGLYAASGAAAAVCLGLIAAVMLAQAGMRAAGLLFRGADDIVAWLCAASAFLALAYTFRAGDLVRVSLLLEQLPPPSRRRAELACLTAALAVVGYITWAAAAFVHESWSQRELAQGLIPIPIWIPQTSLVLGSLILTVAVLDELVAVARGDKPSYRVAEEERLARRDFSENL